MENTLIQNPMGAAGQNYQLDEKAFLHIYRKNYSVTSKFSYTILDFPTGSNPDVELFQQNLSKQVQWNIPFYLSAILIYVKKYYTTTRKS
jgi:hypothetical protein